MENNVSRATENAPPHPASPPLGVESLGRLEGLLHHIIFDLTEALKLLQAAVERRGSNQADSILGPWDKPL